MVRARIDGGPEAGEQGLASCGDPAQGRAPEGRSGQRIANIAT
jgi:hypothetical protein